tara:strand:- start:157 stop:366 length:210 start_codon:yes stop_codon:yes gene_type:complete
MSYYFDYVDRQEPEKGLGIYDGNQLINARPVLVLDWENMSRMVSDYYDLVNYKDLLVKRKPNLTVVDDE